jgi:1-acyl-sn-glycerol-3-phosphate acyltransferase
MSQHLRYPRYSASLYAAMVAVLRFLVNSLTRLHIDGLHNLPATVEPAMYVCNHLHYLDVPVIGVTLPCHAYVLAAEKYQTHLFFGMILRIAGAIFINRGEVDRNALRQAMNVIEDGHALAIAIEGTRSGTKALAEGRNGTAFLARRTGAPIIPVVVWGTENIVAAWKRLRRAEVHVCFGPPFTLAQTRAHAGQLSEHTQTIMLRLAQLLPARYQGIYKEHPALADNPR